jgi:endonuclease VIII
VPEGDTIAWTANRIRPVLEGRVPDEISSPRNPRWPDRLAGQVVARIDTYGKHLFLHFEGGLVLHSHLGMVGSWVVARQPRGGRRAWIVLRAGDRWVAELDGPTLELITEGRVRFDQRLAGLGPDVLAEEFDSARFLARLRDDDPTRAFGEALLDQRNVAGAGLGPLAIQARHDRAGPASSRWNIWKAESRVVDAVRPRMMCSAVDGPRAIQARVYSRAGRPCPRCGTPIAARGQGDANRTTYWCPECQR